MPGTRAEVSPLSFDGQGWASRFTLGDHPQVTARRHAGTRAPAWRTEPVLTNTQLAELSASLVLYTSIGRSRDVTECSAPTGAGTLSRGAR